MNAPSPTRSVLVSNARRTVPSRFELIALTCRYARLFHQPVRHRLADSINAALIDIAGSNQPKGDKPCQ